MVRYLFVDARYFWKVLDNISRDFFGGGKLLVDFRALADSYTKAFYYDCYAPQKDDESDDDYKERCAKQEEEDFRKLHLLDRWHVFRGVTIGKGKEARQKQVDIQIAVDMLTHSHHRNMEQVTFIAGDQDFKPLVDAVVREGMFIELWYEERSVSKDLLCAADAQRKLDVYAVHTFLTKQFQKQHPLPKMFGQIGKAIDNAVLCESGVGDEEGIELYKVEDEYLVLHTDQLNQGYFTEMRSTDLAFLKKCYEAAFGKVVWSKAARHRR